MRRVSIFLISVVAAFVVYQGGAKAQAPLVKYFDDFYLGHFTAENNRVILKWANDVRIGFLNGSTSNVRFMKAFVERLSTVEGLNIEIRDPSQKINVVISITPNVKTDLQRNSDVYEQFSIDKHKFRQSIKRLPSDTECISRVSARKNGRLLGGYILTRDDIPLATANSCIRKRLFLLLGFRSNAQSILPSILSSDDLEFPTELDLDALSILYRKSVKPGQNYSALFGQN